MNRYLILAMRTPQFDPAVIVPHAAHLDRLREQGRLELAGPFTDSTGGAYLVRAETLAAAQAIAATDPVHTSGSSRVSVHEWNAR